MLESPRLSLRHYTKEDASAIVSAINHKEIARFTRIPHPYTLEDAKSFIAKEEKEQEGKSSFAFGIFRKDDGKLVGGIGVHHIHWDDGRGEFGYWLTPEEHGKGYAREAAYCLLRHLFYDLQLNRVEIEITPKNERSIKLAEWLGGMREGLLRKRCCTDRCAHDVYMYGLLREDFEKLDEKGHYRAKGL